MPHQGPPAQTPTLVAACNPPLHGPRLHLEPLRERHADAMYPLLADPALYTHIDHGPPASAKRLHEVYRQLQRRRSPDGSELWLNWVLFAPGDDTPLGTVQATVLQGGRAWVAWVLARHAWGRGHAAEAAAAMLAHLLGPLQVRQAMASIEDANTRSIALARRLGFRLAGADERAAHELTATEQLWLLDAPAR